MVRNMRSKLWVNILFGLAAVFTSVAHGAVTINIYESGGDVIAEVSGSFDTINCNSTVPGNAPGILYEDGTDTEVIVGANASAPVILCTPPAPNVSSPFTGNINQLASSGTGDVFGIGGFTAASEVIYLPRGYVSNTALSGSATFAGQTLSSLNLAVGTYASTAGAETVTITVALTAGGNATAVPAMPAWLLSLMSLLLAGLVYRRRERLL